MSSRETSGTDQLLASCPYMQNYPILILVASDTIYRHVTVAIDAVKVFATFATSSSMCLSTIAVLATADSFRPILGISSAIWEGVFYSLFVVSLLCSVWNGVKLWKLRGKGTADYVVDTIRKDCEKITERGTTYSVKEDAKPTVSMTPWE